MEAKIDKLYKLIIVALALIGILFVFVIGGLFKDSGNNNKNNNTNTAENKEYDVSQFTELDLDGVLKLFDSNKKTYVVYFGRETCSACVSFIPTLKKIQEKYNFTTQYMDITKVNSKSDEFEKLMKKLSKKVTLTVNGEKMTQSFSEYYGYTPMIFIVKNGKFIDGFVGAYKEENFEKFLNNNGIK